jgi:uncharacterized protein (DUF433 family)
MTHERIICNPSIKSGRPVIKGTRIPVETILRWLGKGMSVDDLLDQYPGLTRDDVLAAQTFAADYLADDHVLPAAE